MKTIKLKINGIETEAEDRTPILTIANRLGIKIPTLCHHPILEPYGVCRVCTVEVRSGKRVRMVTACNYPAVNGIEVFTDSERVRRDRKLIIELLMSRCGHVPVIEQLAAEYGITEPRFGRGDDDCILCGLCVRVCQDIIGAKVLGFFRSRHHPRGLDRLRRDLGEVHRLRGLRLCLPDRRDQDRGRRGAGPEGIAARAAHAHQHPLHAGGPASAGHRP